jgi:DNA-binding response OmpR family regulator
MFRWLRESEQEMRIGVLDDNPAIREYLQIALTLAGHSVSVHHTASSLLETLLPNGVPILPLPYDCLLIDIFLPGGYSGIEVYRYIQEQVAPIRPFTILMTAASPLVVTPLLSEIPGIPVLYKPFRLSQLLQLLAAFPEEE